jgi:hypothetical protein
MKLSEDDLRLLAARATKAGMAYSLTRSAVENPFFGRRQPRKFLNLVLHSVDRFANFVQQVAAFSWELR